MSYFYSILQVHPDLSMGSEMRYNRTSAKFLLEVAEGKFKSDDPDKSIMNDRFLLAYDLYIKARSYAIINKIFFWISLIMAVIVISWPALSVVSAEFLQPYKFLKSAVVQTSVTAFAVLCYAIYSHYKKRQTHSENLMRVLVFDATADEVAVQEIVADVQKMDSVFSFQQLKSLKL